MFPEQDIVCKDCEKSFHFSAEDSKSYEEKGYENLPVRCVECRSARNRQVNRQKRARSAGSSKKASEYTKPVPPSASLVTDGKTIMKNGVVVFLGTRGYGFVEYDKGQVYFTTDKMDGNVAELKKGMHIDFACDRDDKDRVQVKTFFLSAKQPSPAAIAAANTASSSDAAPKTAASSSRRRREPKDAAAATDKPARAPRAPRAPRPEGEAKVDRVMIDITVQCPGHETKVIQKPVERGTFTVFRRKLLAAHNNKISKNFRLVHNGFALSHEAFNALKAGDVVVMEEGEADAAAEAK